MDITNSKILCPINSLVVRKTLLVPDESTVKAKNYNEESIVQCFRESTIEKKQEFFKKCFKPDVESLNQPFLVDAALSNKKTQCMVTLLCQYLGLDTDKYIIDPLMCLLFISSTYPIDSDESSQRVHVSCLNFNEFLSENIHSQLMNFHKTKTFRF